MSRFDEVFTSIFRCDYPGTAIGMSLPRLRFEPAVGPKRVALLAAFHRCRSLFEAICSRDDEVWVELSFWNEASCLAKAQGFMERGLRPVERTSWEREDRAYPDDDPECPAQRFSARIPSASDGFDALFRAIVWGDHGGFDGLFVSALVVAPNANLGFHPYDDRGADLFAPEAGALLPLYTAFTTWILECDRSRIEKELGLDDAD